MEINNKLIINRIKLFYNLKTDKFVAEKLGISQQKLSNWKNRDGIQWEIIYRKCEDMDYNYLIKGEKNQTSTNMEHKKEIVYLKQQVEDLRDRLKEKDDFIDYLKNQNRFSKGKDIG